MFRCRALPVLTLAVGLFTAAGGLRGQSPEVLATLKGHTDTVEAVALSPDGTFVATASFDKTAKLYEALTGREVRTFGGEQGHKGQVLAVAFSANGDQLATGGADNFARVWELPTNLPSRTFAISSAATRVVVAADGKTIAVGGSDGAVKIFPAGSDQGAMQLRGHTGPVTHIGQSGTSWATAGADRTVRIWSADGKQIAIYSAGSADVTGLAVGQSVFATGSDGVLRVWPLTPPPSRAFPALKEAVTAFTASSDGTAILYATADKVVTQGNTSNNQATNTFSGAKANVDVVALSSDNAIALAGCADGSVTLWGRQGKVKLEFDAHTGGVTAAAFHPALPILYTAGADGIVKGWSLPIDPTQPEEKAVKQTIKAHTGKVTALVVHPSSGQIITAGADKLVRVWDPNKPEKPVKEIGPLSAPVATLALSRDGQLVAGGAGRDAIVWNPTDWKEAGKFSQPADIVSLNFNSDQSRLAIGRADNLASLIEVRDGAVVQTFPRAGAVRGVLALGTQEVLTASADKSVVVSPVVPPRTIALGGKTAAAIASPDGQRLITVGPGKECASWQTGDGKKDTSFAAGGDALAAALTKDGQRLAVAGSDGSVKLYTVADGKLAGSIAAGEPVTDLAFHPTVPQLVGVRKSDAVVWNVAFQPGQPAPAEFGKVVQTFALPRGAASVAYNADGQFYTASEDKQIRRFRTFTDGPPKALQHPNLVDAVAFDDSGSLLATGCHDGNLRIWDVAKNTAIKTINAHIQPTANPIYAVMWSRDYKQVFTSSYDKSIKLWDVASGNLVREFKGAPEPKLIDSKKDAPKVDPELAIAFLGGLAKGAPPGPPGHRDQVFTMALTKDGKRLATGSSDRTVKLWDVATGRVLHEFANPELKPVLPDEVAPSHPGWVQSVRLTPDDQYLVTAGPAPRGKSYLAVWKLSDGTRVYGATHDFGPIHSLAITPDGSKLVLGCAATRTKPEPETVIIKLPGK